MPIESAVPHFPDPESARAALKAKNNYEPVSLYPRDGTEALHQLELQLAELTRMNTGEVLAFGSGMQAVRAAIELANLTAGDKAVFAYPSYSQTMNYQAILRDRGVDILTPQIESTEHFIDKIKVPHPRHKNKSKPKLIFAETVDNTPDAFALNVEQLLEMPLKEGWDPIIVLDPTMTTPSGRPLAELLDKTDKRVVLVESGTKNYRLNTGLLGLAYTKRSELMKTLQQRRRTNGTTPDVSVVRDTLEVLPSKEAFDERNRAILKNNKLFSEALLSGLKEDSPFWIGHPNLPNHSNHEYTSTHYPNGATQCLFITDQRDGQINGNALFDSLWEVAPKAVDLGQSFGFDKTRLWLDSYRPAVRIACGTEESGDLESLAEKWAKKLNQL